MPQASLDEQRQRMLEIRRYMRSKARPDEIAKALNIDHSTVWRYQKKIAEQDRAWFYEQAKGEFLSSFKLSLEVLEDQQRKALLEIEKGDLSHKDVLERRRLIVEVEMQIFAMLPYAKLLMEKQAQDAKVLHT